MANIGLRKPFVAPLKTAGGYEDPAALGKAVSVEITPNYASASLYGDDALAEKDDEFTSANVTLGVTTVPIEFNSKMFGHTVASDTKETTYNADDEASYVGFGIIGVEKIDGAKKYVANFLPKVKFTEPGKSYNTKGDSLTYNTPSLSGTATKIDSGVWKKDCVCDTEADAIKWIKKQFGVTAE